MWLNYWVEKCISIILNNGNETFLQPMIYSATYGIDIILAMDMNNDRKIDLIYGN